MKKGNLLNPLILNKIAALGHTECCCIADCGLPVPKGVDVIDVSVTKGIPSIMDVLTAVNKELVIESYVYASELKEKNGDLLLKISEEMADIPFETTTHDNFKKMTYNAKFIIRTGEATPYANIILIGGVNF